MSSEVTYESLCATLTAADLAFRKVAENIARERGTVVFGVQIHAMDPLRLEPKADAPHITMTFSGPICKAWVQRKPVTQHPEVQKHMKQSRERYLKVELSMGLRQRVYYPADCVPWITSSTAKNADYDATEFVIESLYETDKPWKVLLEFDETTKQLLWITVSHTPDSTPTIVERVLTTIIEAEEVRLSGFLNVQK